MIAINRKYSRLITCAALLTDWSTTWRQLDSDRPNTYEPMCKNTCKLGQFV